MGIVPHPSDLTEGYYLENFLTLMGEVNALYGDLLTQADRQFSRRFRALPMSSQRLWVRLVSRKGPLFRMDKLHYPEIGSVKSAAIALIDAGMMTDRGTHWNPTDVVALLTKTELCDLLDPTPGARARRQELADLVVNGMTLDQLLPRLPFSILEPLGIEELRKLRLLFFGNLWQDLSELVVTELGVVRYESYRIERGFRSFETAAGVSTSLRRHELTERFYQAVSEKDMAGMLSLVERMPDPGSGVLNTLARQLEREQRFDEALACYRRTQAPPSRERQTRVLFRLERFSEAAETCQAIVEQPVDETELEFPNRFLPRVLKKLGTQGSNTLQQKFRPETQTLALAWDAHARVEEAALRHYRETGWSGFFLENLLWRGLFGLAFWDVVFSPVPGAFANRFQRGPRGLFRSRFREEREEAVIRRLAEIEEDTEWPKRVLEVYDTKQGIANWLVPWNHLDRETVATTVAMVPSPHLATIFHRMSRNLGAYGSGFPDLLIHKLASGQSREYRLVEVKGPGDQLRTNQRLWLRHFAEHQTPALMLRVEPKRDRTVQSPHEQQEQ